MKTKKKNTKTTDPRKNRSEEFPGYPPYNPNEDITRQARRVEGNLSDEGVNDDRKKAVREVQPRKKDDQSRKKNEFDVGKEDLEALGPKDLSMDMGDDESLKHRDRPVDFVGSDLDVPGSELDDADEEIGREDEENNSYSLGGDSKDNLEERQD